MKVFRGFHRPGIAPACALTIGNFDGVHRGHQAMLALLTNEARHRGLPSCVLSFEPQPRDYFARLAGRPEIAPRRGGEMRVILCVHDPAHPLAKAARDPSRWYFTDGDRDDETMG